MHPRFPPNAARAGCCFALAAGLAAQPAFVDEPPADLAPALARLTSDDDASRLTAIRRIGSHRHLFAAANIEAALPGVVELLFHRDPEVRQAAAVACYLRRGKWHDHRIPAPWIRGNQVIDMLGKLFANAGEPRPAEHDASIVALVARSKSELSRVRLLAIHALGFGNDEAAQLRLRTYLESDESVDRWRAVWALGYQNDLDPSNQARLRPVLVAHLEDEKPQVRTWAALALGRDEVARETVYPHLIRVVREGTADQKALATRELAAMGERAADSLPLFLSASDASPATLRKHFIRAIGQLIGFCPDLDSRARALLAAGIAKGDVDTKIAAMVGLEHQTDLDDKAVATLLEVMVSPDESLPNTARFQATVDLRWRALETLAAQTAGLAELTLPALRQLLRAAKPPKEAFYLLQKLGPRARTLATDILRVLDRKDPVGRRRAAETLSSVGGLSPTGLRLLAKALDDPDADVRRAVVEALGSFGGRATFAAHRLLDAADSGSVDAARTVGKIAAESDAVLERLLEPRRELESNAARSRAIALGHSRRSNDKRVAHWLADALDDPSIRLSVIASIEHLKSTEEQLVQKLATLLNTKENDADVYSAVCLATLGAARERAIPALVRVLDSGRDPGAVQWAITGLAQYGGLDGAIVQKIAKKISGAFYSVVAAKAIADLGPEAKSAVPELVRLLKLDYAIDHDTRRELIKALGKIARAPQLAVPVLVDYLGYDIDSFRDDAEQALRCFGKASKPALQKAAAGKHFVRARRARRLLRELSR